MAERKFHIAVVLLFALIAIVLTLGRVGTSFRSFALMTPDLGVYASIAAAQEQPQIFADDPFLSNEKNVNTYHMLYIPLIQGLKKILGNYGTACVFLLPFFIFIHLMGYYVLGLALFKKPWAALFVSLLLSTPSTTNYDFWGLILDSLPRFLYQALIPFVLAFSVWYGKNPKSWIWILASVGLLNYVHPLSSPVWILALALGLWFTAKNMPFGKRLWTLGWSGSILGIVLLPFLMDYFGSTVTETGSVISYDKVIAILQARFFAIPIAHPWLVLANVFISQQGVVFDLLWYLICLIALGGLVYGWLPQADAEHHERTVYLTAWMAGILIGGGIVPIIEHTIFASLKKIPPEFELTRTLRYMMPLILLAAISTLWSFKSEAQLQKPRRITLSNTAFIGVCIGWLALWGWLGINQRTEFRGDLAQNVRCWLQAKIICPLRSDNTDFIVALDAISEKTPPGAHLLSEHEEVAIRYYALRPLMYTYKDGAPLAYTDQTQLLLWDQLHEKMDYLVRIRRFPFRRKEYLKTMVEFAFKTKAEYLLLNETYNSDLYYPTNLQPVYSNGSYSLYKINP
jgi:hypothetical protein